MYSLAEMNRLMEPPAPVVAEVSRNARSKDKEEQANQRRKKKKTMEDDNLQAGLPVTKEAGLGEDVDRYV